MGHGQLKRSSLSGKSTVVEIVATSCSNCRKRVVHMFVSRKTEKRTRVCQEVNKAGKRDEGAKSRDYRPALCALIG